MITTIISADATAPRVARRAVAVAVPPALNDLLSAAQLVVSELVTNAVVHGTGGDITLGVQAGDRDLRIVVTDPGGGFVPPMGRHDGPGGFGLGVVAGLAAEWGIEQGPPTVVWCRLTATSAADAEPVP